LNQFPGGPVVYQIGSTCVYPVASMSGQEPPRWGRARRRCLCFSPIRPKAPRTLGGLWRCRGRGRRFRPWPCLGRTWPRKAIAGRR